MADLKSKLETPRVDWLDQQQVGCDLDAIAEVIRRQGWLQHMPGRFGGPNCLTKAMADVTGRWYPGHKYERTQRIVNALGFRTEDAVVRFNDEKGRTKEEVLQRIQEAKMWLDSRP